MERHEYPTRDEILETKSIVHWKTIKSRLTENERRARLYVRVTCGRCNNRRWVCLNNMSKRSRQGRKFTGVCTNCMGKPGYPKLHGRKPTGRFTCERGYIHLSVPGHSMADSRGFISEHRLVMSNHLGRALDKLEHVHHINGKKGDNRIQNLELVNGVDHCQITILQKRVKQLEALLRNHKITLPR